MDAEQVWKSNRYLISCNGDHQCRVWLCPADNLHFYPSNKDIADKANNHLPKIFNLPRFIFNHDHQIRDFQVDPIRHLLFTVSDDHKMKIWSLKNGNCLYVSNDSKEKLNTIVLIADKTDNLQLFAGSADGLIYKWSFKQTQINHNSKTSKDAQSEQKEEENEDDALPNYTDIDLTADQKDREELQPSNQHNSDAINLSVSVLSGHHNSVNELRVSYIGNDAYLLSADASGFVRCWNIKDSSFQEFRPHKDSVNYMSLGGDLLSNQNNDTLNILSPNTMYENGNILCTASRDKLLRAYSIPTGKLLFSIKDTSLVNTKYTL